jgi:hypothetical protein
MKAWVICETYQRSSVPKFHISDHSAANSHLESVNFGIKLDQEDRFYSHFAGDNDTLQVAILRLADRLVQGWPLAGA